MGKATGYWMVGFFVCFQCIIVNNVTMLLINILCACVSLFNNKHGVRGLAFMMSAQKLGFFKYEVFAVVLPWVYVCSFQVILSGFWQLFS
jgi:hypothetical protein